MSTTTTRPAKPTRAAKPATPPPPVAVDLDAVDSRRDDGTLPDIESIPELRADRDNIRSFADEYARVSAEIKELQTIKDQCGITLREALEGADVAKVRVDHYRVQTITSKREGAIDAAMLLEAGVEAEVIARCRKPGSVSTFVKVTDLDKGD